MNVSLLNANHVLLQSIERPAQRIDILSCGRLFLDEPSQSCLHLFDLLRLFVDLPRHVLIELVRFPLEERVDLPMAVGTPPHKFLPCFHGVRMDIE